MNSLLAQFDAALIRRKSEKQKERARRRMKTVCVHGQKGAVWILCLRTDAWIGTILYFYFVYVIMLMHA